MRRRRRQCSSDHRYRDQSYASKTHQRVVGGNASMMDRYARQMVLPEVGVDGQRRLSQATVLVVGTGGLGCAVLQYLVAAGVGELIVLDQDCVEASNLHRQPLYRMQDV